MEGHFGVFAEDTEGSFLSDLKEKLLFFVVGVVFVVVCGWWLRGVEWEWDE